MVAWKNKHYTFAAPYEGKAAEIIKSFEVWVEKGENNLFFS